MPLESPKLKYRACSVPDSPPQTEGIDTVDNVFRLGRIGLKLRGLLGLFSWRLYGLLGERANTSYLSQEWWLNWENKVELELWVSRQSFPKFTLSPLLAWIELKLTKFFTYISGQTLSLSPSGATNLYSRTWVTQITKITNWPLRQMYQLTLREFL